MSQPAVKIGYNQRLMAYVMGGGREVDAYATGYHQAGRFPASSSYSAAQLAAFQQGQSDRTTEDASPMPAAPSA